MSVKPLVHTADVRRPAALRDPVATGNAFALTREGRKDVIKIQLKAASKAAGDGDKHLLGQSKEVTFFAMRMDAEYDVARNDLPPFTFMLRGQRRSTVVDVAFVNPDGHEGTSCLDRDTEWALDAGVTKLVIREHGQYKAGRFVPGKVIETLEIHVDASNSYAGPDT